jgi:hypothetical protein
MVYVNFGTTALYTIKPIKMTRHELEDKRIVYAQLICFLLAFCMPLLTSIIPEHRDAFYWKSADALVITGTVLLAIKSARDGWEMAAAGFTLISIAWGGYFIQHDFSNETSQGVLASSFYFFLPSMILISFYGPFKWWIRLLTILSVIPPFVVLILVSYKAKEETIDLWRTTNFKFLHLTALFWGLAVFYNYRKHRVINVHTAAASEVVE